MCNNSINKPIFDKTIELSKTAMLKIRPELFGEWNFEKNTLLGFNIYKITKSSEKIVWWLCPKCGSDYDSMIKNRVKSSTPCPYCAGRRVNHTNSLASLRPDLASEWHPTKNGELTPHDFTCNSNEMIWWLCSHCSSDYDMMINSRSRGNSCSYCSGKKVNHTNCLATINPVLALEWNINKNHVDITPFNIAPTNNFKAWWIGDCGHEWKSGIYKRHKNNSKCPYCTNQKLLIGFNDMWTTSPELASLLFNPKDGYKFMQCSDISLDWKCSECSHIIPKRLPNDIKRRGLCCPRCSDKISTGAKMMMTFLLHSNIPFIKEKRFEWLNNRLYDFYLPEYNMIIETHGGQHYEEGFEFAGGRTLQEEQENDRYKYNTAIDNYIDKYIVIDCRRNELDWIQSSIVNSSLNSIVDMNKIDWDKVKKESAKSLLIKTCELFNSGITDTNEIASILSLSRNSVQKFLKEGTKQNWCNFVYKTRQSIVQLSLDGSFIKEWSNQTEAGKHLTGKSSSVINGCLRGTKKSAYGYRWMYLSGYEAQQEQLKVNSI